MNREICVEYRSKDRDKVVESRQGRGVRGFAVLALLLVGMFGTGVELSAQQEAQETPAPEMTEHEKPMMEGCQAMAEKMKKMKAHRAAMDEKLAALTDEMNAATGDAKTEAVAAVVNEMVRQRTSMREMMNMQPHMMRHMMGHQGGGMMGGEMKSMENCPMMKMMSGADEAGDEEEAAHAEHHPEG